METEIFGAFFGLAFLLALGAWLSTSIMVVKQKTAVIVEVFGRFHTVKDAGLRLKYPYPIAVERRTPVGTRVNLRLRELKEHVSVKTRDNAFVSFPVAVQYRVNPMRIKEAFYELDDAQGQIVSLRAQRRSHTRREAHLRGALHRETGGRRRRQGGTRRTDERIRLRHRQRPR